MSTEAQVKRAIAVLLAAYPNAGKSNEEAMTQFVRILERTLEPYPPEVLAELISPRSGIISTSTFLPSIAELKSWCDVKWDKLIPRSVDEQTEEMKLLGGPGDIETPAEREARRAVIKAKFQDLLKELRLTNISTSIRK